MRKTIVWFVILAGLAVAVALSSGGCALLAPATSFKQVDAPALTDAKAKGAQLVDVRSEGEFKLGHIAGAVNVPVDVVQTTVANWDRKGTYVLYCASGQRSATAMDIMKSMGFTKVSELKDGLNGWTGKLVTDDQSSSGLIQTSGTPVMVEFYTDS